METLEKVLNDRQKTEIIIDNVMQHFGQTWEQVNVTCRRMDLVRSRQIVAYLVNRYTSLSLAAIACMFEGGSNKYFKPNSKNHSTIITSIRKVEDFMYSDKHFKQTIEALKIKIEYEINN